jgi:hypothetical protein
MPPMVNCSVCGEPIMWCLDMFSYTCENPHRLAHARCVWRPEAFDRQKRLARAPVVSVVRDHQESA